VVSEGGEIPAEALLVVDVDREGEGAETGPEVGYPTRRCGLSS